MTIKHVILGFLSETPLTGYDLKKKFSSSELFHWSGNNNQIYRALIELHEGQLVSLEVQQQDSKPPRKIYSLTEQGRAALRKWIVSTPELPQWQNELLMRLMWADQVAPAALKKMLTNHAEELEAHLVMVREQTQRNHTAGEMTLASRAAAHFLDFYEREHEWVRELLQTLEER